MTCTTCRIIVTGDLINELKYDTAGAAQVIQGSSFEPDEWVRNVACAVLMKLASLKPIFTTFIFILESYTLMYAK